MQAITATVGDGGTNTASDVALVQAILVKTERPATQNRPAGPFLASYDGDCGPITKAAIRDFQNHFVFVSADGTRSEPNANATDGIVREGDATWAKLLERVPQDFANMRVIPGGRIVYVAATDAQLQTRLTDAGAATFTTEFREKVVACINRMHTLHGIAIGVCVDGSRRNFQRQAELLARVPRVTNAGPGESNHNFGMAVDLGFEGLRWLRSDGSVIENETSWLHRLEAQSSAQALVFWNALRTVGTSTEVGMFRGPEADRPHLQNWDDAGVSMAARLADLLTRQGTMRWEGRRGAYSSDLGLGGQMYPVGSAIQIWNSQATVTAEMLDQARAGQAAAAAGVGQRPGQPNVQPPGNQRPGGRATAEDVAAMRLALRRQFELADADWQNWTPR